jgi:hypothetical protein
MNDTAIMPPMKSYASAMVFFRMMPWMLLMIVIFVVSSFLLPASWVAIWMFVAVVMVASPRFV